MIANAVPRAFAFLLEVVPSVNVGFRFRQPVAQGTNLRLSFGLTGCRIVRGRKKTDPRTIMEVSVMSGVCKRETAVFITCVAASLPDFQPMLAPIGGDERQL